MQVLSKHSGPLSVKDLSTLTGIKVDDIVYTLQSMQLVQYHKGQHVLCAAPAVIEWCASSSVLCCCHVGCAAMSLARLQP